jgi:hypothetical protein
MRKKVKSFALEDGPYEKLFDMFKENYIEISISYCINKYIKEFLEYLKSVQTELNKDRSITVPMSFIIETVARQPVFKRFESEIGIKEEVKGLQRRYENFIRKNPELDAELNNNNTEKNGSITVSLIKIFKSVLVEEIQQGRDLTDDEIVEISRRYGNKGMQKYIREKRNTK